MKNISKITATLLAIVMFAGVVPAGSFVRADGENGPSPEISADEEGTTESEEAAEAEEAGTEAGDAEEAEITSTATPTQTPTPAQRPSQYTNAGVYDYVVRLYGTVLGRTPDQTGLDDWYSGLLEGRFEAAQAALGFFESPEYIQKQTSNEQYVADLYRTFFDREGDDAGTSAWLERLSEGVSRRSILKGFTDSDEFTRLCERFGVIKGTVELNTPDESTYMVYRFVNRLYSEALGRAADEDGRRTWVTDLVSNGATGANVAYGFVFSPECQANTTDSAAFVQVLYRTLLGREADGSGLESWLQVLASGESREKVFEGFVNSDEFTAICQQYGINRGEYHVGRYIDPNRPMIALTFDDGPCGRTHEILDCIEQNGGAVTFFVQGCNAQYYPNELRRMLDLGCEIGNHSYDHPYLSRLSAEGVASQVGRTNDIVRNATGSNPTVLRPPYGAHSDVSDAVCGLPVIIWSVDTRDWATRNTQSTIDHVLSHARDGEIVLMHDIHPSTVDAALYLIPELQRRGYQLVTVSELAQYRGDGAQAGSVYYSFR